MKRIITAILLSTAALQAQDQKKKDDYSRFRPVSQNVLASIDPQGDGSGLILQAYTACLRNTPGVEVVPLGRPADAQVQVISVILAGKTGYGWAARAA